MRVAFTQIIQMYKKFQQTAVIRITKNNHKTKKVTTKVTTKKEMTNKCFNIVGTLQFLLL